MLNKEYSLDPCGIITFNPGLCIYGLIHLAIGIAIGHFLIK